jgi:hypothetical protein
MDLEKQIVLRVNRLIRVRNVISADAQDACGIADAAAIERHIDNLLFDLG